METDEQETNRLLADTDEEHPTRRTDAEAPSGPSDLLSAFSLFQNYFDKKLVDLKDDLREESQHSADQAAKKYKESSDLTFKYEGNKQQYKFNRELLEKIEGANKALQRKNIPQATERLKELTKQVQCRSKLIRLADKSPAGWDLVNEYLSDELASGSDDEKRIKKAEQAALRKRNSKLRARTVRRPQPYQTPASLSSSSNSFASSAFRPRSSSHTSLRKAAPTDICFACGLTGH